MNNHNWQEVGRYDGVKGFLCSYCEKFVKYNSTRPVDGCVAKDNKDD